MANEEKESEGVPPPQYCIVVVNRRGMQMRGYDNLVRIAMMTQKLRLHLHQWIHQERIRQRKGSLWEDYRQQIVFVLDLVTCDQG